MAKPKFVRTIVKIGGKVTVSPPWDFTEKRAPYIEYAVTVLSKTSLRRHIVEAAEKKINWYGLPDNPYVKWL